MPKIVLPVFLKKFILRLIWFLLIVFAVMLAASVILSGCMAKHLMSDRNIDDYFKNEPVKPTYHSYEVSGRQIHYASIGNDTLPMVLFVHGSPGAWYAFISLFKDSSLYNHVHIVSVDRPGFGKSGLGKPVFSLKEQAAMLMPVLKENKSAKLPLLIGHSLGGPVVSRMAMDYPDSVGGLLIIAGSVDPAIEKEAWYRYAGNFFLVRPFLPKPLNASNREILKLKPELENMVPLWKNIHIPVTVLQGQKDDSVPPENADFLRKMLTGTMPEIVMIPEMNHFIPWRRPDLIHDAILKYLAVKH